jgi:ATP-dependent helicase/DNAse subunit B
LAIDILEEYKIFYNLFSSSGFTGVEDNYKIREMLNKIIYEIRRMQDFMIKTNTKSKIANAISKKLKKKDCSEGTSRLKADVDDDEENREVNDI